MTGLFPLWKRGSAELTQAFIDLGYRIRIDKVYAHEYGVPQRRKRVFIIGNRIGVEQGAGKISVILIQIAWVIRRIVVAFPPYKKEDRFYYDSSGRTVACR